MTPSASRRAADRALRYVTGLSRKQQGNDGDRVIGTRRLPAIHERTSVLGLGAGGVAGGGGVGEAGGPAARSSLRPSAVTDAARGVRLSGRPVRERLTVSLLVIRAVGVSVRPRTEIAAGASWSVWPSSRARSWIWTWSCRTRIV
jgi:hypothetical protein